MGKPIVAASAALTVLLLSLCPVPGQASPLDWFKADDDFMQRREAEGLHGTERIRKDVVQRLLAKCTDIANEKELLNITFEMRTLLIRKPSENIIAVTVDEALKRDEKDDPKSVPKPCRPIFDQVKTFLYMRQLSE